MKTLELSSGAHNVGAVGSKAVDWVLLEIYLGSKRGLKSLARSFYLEKY